MKRGGADAASTLWLDEAGVNCGMTRLYGRAPSNGRVNDYVPDARFKRVSIVGALGRDRITAPPTHKGALSKEVSGLYVKKCLAAAMKTSWALIIGSLSTHKAKGALQPLVDKGVNAAFFPPRPQDFNPIGQA